MLQICSMKIWNFYLISDITSRCIQKSSTILLDLNLTQLSSKLRASYLETNGKKIPINSHHHHQRLLFNLFISLTEI